jgi:hypothetical protein
MILISHYLYAKIIQRPIVHIKIKNHRRKMRQWYNFKTQRLRCPLSHKEILRSNLIDDIAIGLDGLLIFADE